MKLPSRRLPRISKHYVGWRGTLTLLTILCAILYGISPWLLAAVPVAIIYTAVDWKRQTRRLEQLQAQRQGESICQFARALGRKEVDTWVVRAVYEEIQDYVSGTGPRIPIRVSDHLFNDLEIDEEDLELDLVQDIAKRCGRSLSACEENPYFDRVHTVEDLARFFDAQPAEG